MTLNRELFSLAGMADALKWLLMELSIISCCCCIEDRRVGPPAPEASLWCVILARVCVRVSLTSRERDVFLLKGAGRRWGQSCRLGNRVGATEKWRLSLLALTSELLISLTTSFEASDSLF